MGVSYKYKCNGCEFEKEYFIGGGFFTEKYYDETEKLIAKLKNDSLNGKYGGIIRSIIESDTNNELYYSCGTNLFQCNNCKSLLIWREKEIINNNKTNKKYSLKIEIKQKCPECNSDNFSKVENLSPFCPKCKKEQLELVSLGRWD